MVTCAHAPRQKALRLKTNLEFAEDVLDALMAQFARADGEIGFNEFAELIMGSGADDATGWNRRGRAVILRCHLLPR